MKRTASDFFNSVERVFDWVGWTVSHSYNIFNSLLFVCLHIWVLVSVYWLFCVFSFFPNSADKGGVWRGNLSNNSFKGGAGGGGGGGYKEGTLEVAQLQVS